MAGRAKNIKLISPVLPALLLLYLAVALAHAYLAPLTTGPDELAHYEYVNFIAGHGRIPQTIEERNAASYKSDQPPLYHVLAALPATWIDPAGPPFLKRVEDHPRRQLIERTRHAWGLYNTEDELWPYRAEVLRWQVGRWTAILFGLGAVALTFLIARDVFARVRPGESLIPALGAALVVAFIPRFTLTGSMLNYETTVLFFASLYLWAVLRVSKSSETMGVYRGWHLVLLGLFMGLAIVTKLSAVILLVETAAALWLIERYSRPSSAIRWRVWFNNVLLAFVSAGVVLALWFGFVIYHFNTVAQDGWYVGLLRPLIAADASDATTNRLLSFLTGGEAGFTGAIENLDSGPPWEWAATTFRTFWVADIEQHLPLGWVGILVALGLCGVAGYGLVLMWRNAPHPPIPNPQKSHLILMLLLLHLLSPLVLPLIRYAVTFSLADTAQGRHILFLAAPAFAVLLVWGFCSAVSRLVPRVLRYIGLVPGAFLLLWSGVQIWVMSWAYLPPLPVQTAPEARTQAVTHVGKSFNDYVNLIGYTQQLDPQNQMLQIDLLWESTAVSPVDYLTEVSLVDAAGQVQAQWLGYPAEGRYPTRAWDVGDIVRDTVYLPVGDLEAAAYQIELNLLPTNHFDLPDTGCQPLDTPLILTTIIVPDFPPVEQHPYRIWQQGQPLDTPHRFRYREMVLVTLSSEVAAQQPSLSIVSEGGTRYRPVREVGRSALFIVGPDWRTGEYRLQIGGGELGFTSEPLIKVIDRWQRQFEPVPMQHAVNANFANQVKLLSYDLGANRAEPGGGIPLTLYWQGLDWMGSDYTIFTKLLAADQTVHGGRDRLPQEGYRTLYWAPGEIVVDAFGLPVDADAPDGIYTINLGLYKKVNGQAVSLPLMQDGQPLDASSVNIGPVKIGGAPPGLTLAAANPQHNLEQPFGEPPYLTLLGYDLVTEASTLHLTLYWRSEAVLPVDHTTFVHLRDAAGHTVAQKDQPPLNGAYPTSLWDPGEIIADEITLPLPGELPAGVYSLVVGLYDFNTGQRLAVPDTPANEVRLTEIEQP